MSILLSKENWKLFSRKTKSFWDDFRRNKIGLVGLVTILLYGVVAILSPWMTQYDPLKDTGLASGYAMPEWVTVFPQFSELPRTMRIPIYLNVSDKPTSVSASWGEQTVINYLGGSAETAFVNLNMNFTYPYTVSPKMFLVLLDWEATKVKNLTYSFDISFIKTNGTVQPFWWDSASEDDSGSLYLNSDGSALLNKLGLDPVKVNLAGRILSEPGEYRMLIRVAFMPSSEDATGELRFSNGQLRLLGLVHGYLGTDNTGADLYSQLIAGVKISLIIGLFAAIMSTTIGLGVGVVAGYVGGVVDEISMRIVDILLCIPVLPLVLTLMFIYGKSPFYLIVIIALFYWLGLARIVRSQTLSLREMPFIECAKASGAGKFYIIIRHLIPNTLPVAFAHMVLSIPGAIILEASLSFLGFGDPSTSTWGRMLNQAFSYGAFTQLAWWWIFPPGLAIVGICLGFVFLGQAVDEVANPRLRRRR